MTPRSSANQQYRIVRNASLVMCASAFFTKHATDYVTDDQDASQLIGMSAGCIAGFISAFVEYAKCHNLDPFNIEVLQNLIQNDNASLIRFGAKKLFGSFFTVSGIGLFNYFNSFLFTSSSIAFMVGLTEFMRRNEEQPNLNNLNP